MSGQPAFSPEIIAKAEKLLGEVAPDGTRAVLQDPENALVWWVTPSSGSAKRYRVQTDYRPGTRTLSWITCTCPHGSNRGAGQCRCYHAAAVLMLLRDQKLAEEHQPWSIVGRSTVEGCTCGWPTEKDWAMHTPKWRPRFAEHLLDERRKVG